MPDEPSASAAAAPDPAWEGIRAELAALPRPPLDPALRRRLLAAAPRPAARTIPFPRRRWLPSAAAALLALAVLPQAVQPPAAAPVLDMPARPSAPRADAGPSLSTWPLSVTRSARLVVAITAPAAGPAGGLRLEGLDAAGRVVMSLPALPPGVAPASFLAPGERWEISAGTAAGVTRIRLRRGDEVGAPLPVP